MAGAAFWRSSLCSVQPLRLLAAAAGRLCSVAAEVEMELELELVGTTCHVAFLCGGLGLASAPLARG